MPESVKEALRSDGTAFTVVGDSNITAGRVADQWAVVSPKYPIVISLASEAMDDREIAPLTNYVAAGAFCWWARRRSRETPTARRASRFRVRQRDGHYDGYTGACQLDGEQDYFTKQLDHRLVSHIPAGELAWNLPSSAEEIPVGHLPVAPFSYAHQVWKVQATARPSSRKATIYPSSSW